MTPPQRAAPPRVPSGSGAVANSVDVAIVGCGPVGLCMALQLGRLGHRVAVLERHINPYPLPRAVHFDDEVARLMQQFGIRPDTSPEIEPFDSIYTFRNADLQTLLQADWRGVGPSGWHVANFFSQPQLEKALADLISAELPNVHFYRGVEVTSLKTHKDSVTAVGHFITDQMPTVEITAEYLVGCDGANSTVGRLAGMPADDLGFHYDWLCVDVIPPADMEFEPLGWQLCDPERPTTLAPAGPGRRRWEFMLLPGETAETLAKEKRVWALLERWDLTPRNATLERFAVYRFEARCAQNWRADRVFIAGDAAHLMPPFAGQGLCAGIRDTANLSWKLDLVFRGKCSHDLLDSYQQERAHHVRGFIDLSMRFGEIVCVTDPTLAAKRDEAMLAAIEALEAAMEMPPPPRLGPGISVTEDPNARTLSIQGRVRHPSNGREGLFDDLTDYGSGWKLLSSEPLPQLTAAAEQVVERFAVHQAVISSHEFPGSSLLDIDGSYDRWFRSLGVTVVLVRPDFYIFGTALDPADASDLLLALGDIPAVTRSSDHLEARG